MPTNQETAVNTTVEENSPIPLLNSDLKGLRTKYINGEIETTITIKNKSFKRTFINEVEYKQTLGAINILNNTIDEEALYNHDFRMESINFAQSIKNNWRSYIIPGLISSASAAGSVILMSPEGAYGLPNSGAGIWNAPQASGELGIGVRAINALAPLALTMLAGYVEDNRYAWDKSTYNKSQIALAAGDFVAMVATIGETYNFNRGNLAPEDMYRAGALLDWDNLKKVFLNDFSQVFLPEQVVRTVKNGVRVLHFGTGAIERKTVENLTNIFNSMGALIVSGAFANVSYGIVNGGKNPGHGVEVLPNTDPVKNIIGVSAVAAGVYYGTIDTLKNMITSVINYAFSQQESKNQEEESLNPENPRINDIIESDEASPIINEIAPIHGYGAISVEEQESLQDVENLTTSIASNPISIDSGLDSDNQRTTEENPAQVESTDFQPV